MRVTMRALDPLHSFQWQVTAPYTILSDKLRPPTQISVTSYGHPTQNSVTSYGPPTLISVTIGTRILKLKLKMKLKMKLFTIFTVFIVILWSFYTIYVEISFHLIIPLMWCWGLFFCLTDSAKYRRKVFLKHCGSLGIYCLLCYHY